MLNAILDYYKEKWHGNFDGTDEELSLLLSRATDIIDNAICMSGYTIRSVPETLSEPVNKAVCAQTDYIISQGGAESLTDSSYGSVSLGKFSYTGGSSNGSEGSSAVSLCKLAESYLVPTGLLYRGVNVL